MYISAFLHRNELFDITNRWLSNQLDSEDPLQITKIIAYDSFSAWETLLLFSDNFLQNLNSSHILRKKISQKKDLKDFICNTKNQNSGRAESLISEYMKMPEFFYIGSPFAGYIYHDSHFQILSICRFKRVKRIAEKASRYASIYFFDKIEAATQEILKKRMQFLPSTKQLSNDIFIEAEKMIMLRIKKNGIKLPVQAMTIKDILGIKVIDNGFGAKKLESAIAQYSGAKIVEKEKHSGQYNAVHYVVELKVDFIHLIDKFKNNRKEIDFIQKGLPVERLNEDFAEFVVTGADTVHVDLIFTSFEELIESEIGRSMHENRIFRQRQQNKVYGNIPINIEYIIEFLIAVGLSPTIQIDEIPIKIWGRYLPDTLSDRIRKIYQMSNYSMICE
ncbi:MAG: hypothetical protein ABII68_12570 [Pseudomonadota bacterium]